MLIRYESNSYLVCSMTLHLVSRSRLLAQDDSSPPHSQLSSTEDGDAAFKAKAAHDHLNKALPFAHRAAQLLRDFRERYGLKITPAWLLQLQAVAAGVLLLDPALQSASLESSLDTVESSTDDIADSRTAFDEVFRCLLGAGVEVMISRAIARMTYHTALKQRVMLSRPVFSMLQLMSQTAWRTSDLSLVNSKFPNFATTRGHVDDERLTELLQAYEAIEI